MNAVFLLVTTAWLPAAEPGLPQTVEIRPATAVAYQNDSPVADEAPPEPHHGLWDRIKGLFHHQAAKPGCACGRAAPENDLSGGAVKILPQPTAPMETVIDGGVYEKMPTTVEPPLK